MRALFVALTACLIMVVGFGESVWAVGSYTVGKEDCSCSPLTAKGIKPDTLNQLKESVDFPIVYRIIDRLAGEVKAILSQFGVKTIHKWEEAKAEPAPKPVKAEASKKPKRRIKRPPMAM